MIAELKNVPNTIVGFRVSGNVTKEDFDKTVLPAVAELVQRTGKLNYLMVLDSPLSNFSAAWLKEGVLGLNHLDKWNRVAIVTHSEGIKPITDFFSKVVQGDFKSYNFDELDAAISWVSGGDIERQVFQEEGERED